MKIVQHKLNNNDLDVFFPHERIKSKTQVLIILLEATRFILYNETDNSQYGSKLLLFIKKMSRIIFTSDDKFYTINFPFTYIVDNGVISINYKNLVDLNSKTISDLLSFFKDTKFNSSSCLDFVDPICDLDSEYENGFWTLVRDLLMMEDGYLRFDKDTEGYLKAKEQGKEHVHPEHHIDVFYSNNNTFKIGLKHKIIDETFLDYLDTQTDCMYLKSF